MQSFLNFESPQLLHGEFPFSYHLLRIGNGDLSGKFWHVNSIWSGYNSSGYPETECESRFAKYSIAESTNEISQLINDAANDCSDKTHYIMAKMHFSVYRGMSEFLE